MLPIANVVLEYSSTTALGENNSRGRAAVRKISIACVDHACACEKSFSHSAKVPLFSISGIEINISTYYKKVLINDLFSHSAKGTGYPPHYEKSCEKSKRFLAIEIKVK